jgi:tRNA threonylcarbamoyl adenosine modification protein (Sua5/YciO/YrdC/YwlC family)
MDVVDLLALDDPVALGRVVAALLAGEAVVVPTETVYGVATLPQHQSLLLELKGRPETVPIAVLVADGVQAAVATGTVLPPLAVTLAAAFWPGPLTLVLPTAAGPTLGVRCPDHDFVRAVAAAVGPIATTSANRHGAPTPPSASEAAAALAGPVAVVIDGGTIAGAASTVVDATGERPVILRQGPIQSADIEAAVP